MRVENAKFFLRQNVRYFVALAFFLLLLQDVFGPHGLLAMHRSKVQIEQVREETQKLVEENQDLTHHIDQLKTNPEAIEKIARDRMGLARPGELIFRMPDPKQNSQPAPPDTLNHPKN